MCRAEKNLVMKGISKKDIREGFSILIFSSEKDNLGKDLLAKKVV
jgi:hypothetical protein